MQTKSVNFTYRGRQIEGEIVLPETVDEAVALLGEKEVMDSFAEGHIERQKRKLRRKKERRWFRVDLKSADESTLEKLRSVGLLE